MGATGSVLGVVADALSTTTRLSLAPGDTVVAVTDGILEIRHNGEEFGDEGLRRILAAAGDGSAAAVAESIESSALEFASRPAADDLAILVLRVAPAAG
jgi:serine phosphatase RsbU (regulator of sigma subunit)